MAFVVRLVKRHHRGKPDLFEHRITCDHCGLDIDDARLANALWWSDVMEYGATVDVNTVHKSCTLAFEATSHGMWYSDELALYLQGVVDNAGLGTGADLDTGRAHGGGTLRQVIGEAL